MRLANYGPPGVFMNSDFYADTWWLFQWQITKVSSLFHCTVSCVDKIVRCPFSNYSETMTILSCKQQHFLQGKYYHYISSSSRENTLSSIVNSRFMIDHCDFLIICTASRLDISILLAVNSHAQNKCMTHSVPSDYWHTPTLLYL